MIKHKGKQKTQLQLLVHIGGFLASLPILLFLMGLLLLLVFVLSVIIFLGDPTDSIIRDAMPFLLATWSGAIINIVMLVFGVFRYGKGILRGLGRLQGLRTEKSRIDQILQPLADVQDDDLNSRDGSTESVAQTSSLP